MPVDILEAPYPVADCACIVLGCGQSIAGSVSPTVGPLVLTLFTRPRLGSLFLSLSIFHIPSYSPVYPCSAAYDTCALRLVSPPSSRGPLCWQQARMPCPKSPGPAGTSTTRMGAGSLSKVLHTSSRVRFLHRVRASLAFGQLTPSRLPCQVLSLPTRTTPSLSPRRLLTLSRTAPDASETFLSSRNSMSMSFVPTASTQPSTMTHV